MDKRRWVRPIVPPGRPLRWALPVLVLAGLLLLQWLLPGWTGRAEAWTVDARFRLRGAERPRNNIVIVALDEDSFQMMGNLQGENIRTWPRARWAELVQKIASGNPRLIALDVVFDTPGWDASGDEAFAAALAGAKNVILAAHLKQVGGAGYTSLTFSEPITRLAESAAAVSVVNLLYDADGGVRRTGLLYSWGGRVYSSFSLATATLFSGERATVSADDLEMGLPIHFRGLEGTFRTIPMYRVLSDQLVENGLIQIDEMVDPTIFRDAIVLVGYTTKLEQDRYPAPFAGKWGMPGVEIQANAIDMLLAGDWLHRAPAWLPLVLVGMAGLLALVALNLRRSALGVVLLAGGVIVYLAVGQALFARADFILPLVAPVAALLVVGGVALAERMVFAERDKRRIRQRLAGVMSPERLQAVLDNWEALLASERPQKEVAVLFADVRGFTNATETLMRQGRAAEMVRFLSAYLDAMSEAVFAEGGVIYDVVGDGLMILFGVPEPFPDYGWRAVKAAVDMALATGELQPVWPLRDQRPLEMGIGVHCGKVVDAVVGRGRRINYAVIGDPVNTAARIQDHCKAVMTVPRPPGGEVPQTVTILISADLYDQVRGRVLVDESVPPFAARGKAEPLRVVRLLGL
jgi:adenylate cyclase